MKQLELINVSKEKIVAHLFEPLHSNKRIIVINSATGVKQQVYFKTAQFLTDNGFTVITYDYRGIGFSKPKDLKKCTSSMKTWGAEDYKCITDYVKVNFNHFEKYLIGHSVGALILGMNKDSTLFTSFIFIGTQKAYVGHLNLSTKIAAYAGFGVLQPLITRIFGYFPAHCFGLGESLPAEVAKDWRSLILNKKSTNVLLEENENNYAKKLHQKVLILRAEDDHWLTEKGVHNLMAETYPNLDPTYQILKISESPKKEIGHINFFRSYNKPLWKIILKEFLK